MRQRLTLTDKSIKALSDLNNAKTDTDRLVILSLLYADASNNGASDAEEFFKSKSRENTARLITIWFYSVNILTVAVILLIFGREFYLGTLGSGIITSSVIISLIGATVAQNAAAFLLFAKYAFNLVARHKGEKSEMRKPAKTTSKIP